ncbi:Alw26I/Eco31I/Esp3I family type II restriction endonuclease [Iningainema tapete]|uniref:Alw26I/Eco31I/Esp3I family type II restriction endonuclease n=1 Tax=Iningainema tapete BLCC-T55 TaxID=2748662 RepID=A0A8J6XH30_9CYAN|nr:Alw26I/Eco31I/Esp3I family type II restriction endonuclease [Iningainema tapete]MBD2776690.1 Alw26I/Eco31I/Esp3I family type II restriction endonuclease [Iningainema tapete BLCC-T55]
MTNKPKYGNKGEVWHPDFIRYMEFIANHPVYAGMPDAFTEGGKIQWEAPSNRKSGKHKDTHHKRREWWRIKAVSIGVNPNSDRWISRTARVIHPTLKKPCKRCGKVMELRYVYPSNSLLQRLNKLGYVDENFPLESYEKITDLVTRLVEVFGDSVFSNLTFLLKTGAISPPLLEPSLESWLNWIEKEYVPKEPSLLSPGAMSNAPDRFDGFHSFNQCCRSKVDKGRSKVNLKSYTTDRRVFEYWTEGDWIAANRLMGQIKANFGNEACLNSHPGPCSGDHIGPLSLGFTHRPEFQLLCKSCNSAKNNRMTLREVIHLREVEATGVAVISWHSKALWNLRKEDVVNNETALRLSKMLRDNRHTLMSIFKTIADAGHFTFLATFLELGCAERKIDFINLRVEQHITKFDRINYTSRETKYVAEQKSRRCRVAFESLRDYFIKDNRNAIYINTDSIKSKVEAVLVALQQSSDTIKNLDTQIAAMLSSNRKMSIDEGFRGVVDSIPTIYPPNFVTAKQQLIDVMALVAVELSNQWTGDRYVRGELNLDT